MNHLVEAKKIIKKLEVPAWINFLTQEYVEENTNGCGDKKTAWIVPENILGLSIKIACDIHDLEYTRIINMYNSYIYDKNIHLHQAKKLQVEADKRFLNNMKILAREKFKEEKVKGVWSLLFWRTEQAQARVRKKTRLEIIKWFYLGVKYGGWSSLKDSLNKKNKLKEVKK